MKVSNKHHIRRIGNGKGKIRKNPKKKQIVVTAHITQNLEAHHIKAFLKEGLKLLKKPNKEDSAFFKLRVVSKRHKIWIIEDGQAITLLYADDY